MQRRHALGSGECWLAWATLVCPWLCTAIRPCVAPTNQLQQGCAAGCTASTLQWHAQALCRVRLGVGAGLSRRSLELSCAQATVSQQAWCSAQGFSAVAGSLTPPRRPGSILPVSSPAAVAGVSAQELSGDAAASAATAAAAAAAACGAAFEAPPSLVELPALDSLALYMRGKVPQLSPPSCCVC